MAEQFPFPERLTRRERWLFEKHAQITLQEFGELLETTPEKVSTQMEAALVLVAVKRVRPSVTIDQVLDSDWELLPPPSGEAAASEEGEEGESPLAPPSPTSMNSPTPGSSASPGESPGTPIST